MAKKTSYLTELIERHERWKAEGGERAEEEDVDADDVGFDLTFFPCLSHKLTPSFNLARTHKM